MQVGIWPAVPIEAKEGLGSPLSGVTRVDSQVGGGNPTHDPWKSNQCS